MTGKIPGDAERRGTKIKICGLVSPEDIDYVNEACPDYCGFVIGFQFLYSFCGIPCVVVCFAYFFCFGKVFFIII